MLAEEGYVQSMHGIGVRVIYRPVRQTSFTIGGIESFKESAQRNGLKVSTKVVQFMELTAHSIYDYIENTLEMSIVTSKRIMTVERVTEIDEKYPDYFCFQDTASRKH